MHMSTDSAVATPTTPKRLARFAVVRQIASIVWFPLFFAAGFLCFYFVPFHHIAPHDLPVAVVGRPLETDLAHRFDARAPGSFHFTAVTNAAAARTDLLNRSIDGALEIRDRSATLFVAGADGSALPPVLEKTFGPVAKAARGTLRTVDVAPVKSGDPGTAFLYVALVFNLVAYVLVMFTVQHIRFGRTRSLILIIVFGAILSGAVWPIAWTSGVLPVKPAIIPLSFLLFEAVAWTGFGLVPFARRAVPAVLLALFVLLSIPSSGGVIPVALLPGLCQFLEPIMPLGNYISAGRGILYLHDHALLQPILTLCAWLLAGIALVSCTAVRARSVSRQRADAEDRADASVDVPPAPAGGAEGWAVVYGSVVDERGRAVSAGTVTTTTAEGVHLTRAAIRTDGSYATLLEVDADTLVVVTAFGAQRGAGATPVRVPAGRQRVRAEVQLVADRHRRISQERYDAASAAAASAVAGTV